MLAVDSGVPRPTSILDHVALAHGRRAFEHRPVRELLDAPPRRGALGRGRPGHWRGQWPFFAFIAVTLGAVVVIRALDPPETETAPLFQIVIGAAWIIMSSLWPVSDRRLGAVRWLRVAPLLRARRAAESDGADAGALVEALRIRITARSEFLADVPREARVRDVRAGPRAATRPVLAIGLYFVVIGLLGLFPRSPGGVGEWMLWIAAAGMLAVLFLSLRRRLPARIAKQQRNGLCPDCGYQLRGIGHDAVLHGAGLDLGPAQCPECGVRWPLVPPPTAEEVIHGRRGAGAAGL